MSLVNTIIKIDNVDVSKYCSYDNITLYQRNFDFTQVFPDFNFTISKHYRAIETISDKESQESIVEVFLNDELVYTGYVSKIDNINFYEKNIKSEHIIQKLKTRKVLKNETDSNLQFVINDEWDVEDDFSIQDFIKTLFIFLGYTNVSSSNNCYFDSGLVNIYDYANQTGSFDLTNFSKDFFTIYKYLPKYLGQNHNVVQDGSNWNVVLETNYDNSPNYFEILTMMQKLYRFKIRLNSYFSGTKIVYIESMDYIYCSVGNDGGYTSFNLPEGTGLNLSFTEFVQKITLTEDAYIDKRIKKIIEQQSYSFNFEASTASNIYDNGIIITSSEDDANNIYINILREFNLIKKNTKSNDAIKNFYYYLYLIDNSIPFIAFPMQFNFNYSYLKFEQYKTLVCAYDRWVYMQDYAAQGNYTQSYKKNSTEYYEETLKFKTDDLTKLTNIYPRKITYNLSNDLFVINQDRFLRNF